MPAAPTATPEHIRDANTRYHDAAAGSYDAKWGIDFGPVGQRQVVAKMAKALGPGRGRGFTEALEIGAGTGYFSLNLLQAGVIERATATDISRGMLEALGRSAARLSLDVHTERAGAEDLPFDPDSFDLVFGHAVLHHIPDLERALAELERVLRPGGVVAFCGEPSAYGNRIAALPKRVGLVAAPAWRAALGAPARENGREPGPRDARGALDGHALEAEVDVHAFAPRELSRMLTGAGLEDVRVRGEELVANMYGWTVRTLESTADPEGVPRGWRSFAFRSYLALQRLDSAVLEPRLPPQLFYNLVLSARKPG